MGERHTLVSPWPTAFILLSCLSMLRFGVCLETHQIVRSIAWCHIRVNQSIMGDGNLSVIDSRAQQAEDKVKPLRFCRR